MNPLRTLAVLILCALAALAFIIFGSVIASFASTNQPMVFACWFLTGVCFILNVIWAIRAASLAPQTAGIVSPSLLIKLGREYGRMYTVAGIAGYLQILFMGLALLLEGVPS